jgi:hypothetical protein
MRLGSLSVALVLFAATSSVVAGQGTVEAGTQPGSQEGSLPVSVDRIRDALARPPALVLDRQAHFKVEITEQQKFDELLATLDFKAGPVPAAGLYGHEMQRMIYGSPVDRPLAQPYAAFSGGELLTIALQNLIGHYLGRKAIDAIAKPASLVPPRLQQFS